MKKQKNILLSYRVQRFDAEIVERLFKYKNDKIYIVVQDVFEKNFISALIKLTKKLKNLNLDINIITTENFLKGELDYMLKKFDYIVGNPPYQTSVGNKGKQISLWDKLVVKFYDMLKDKGEMTLVHPGGWRFSQPKANNDQYKVKEIYKTNKIIKMELNDKIKGYETFGASTDYDVVTLIKEKSADDIEIETMTDGKFKTNISKMGMIPTDNFSVFNSLKATKGEEKVELIHDSKYHHSNGGEKCVIRQEKNNIFKYPCVYTITEKGGIKFTYSNTRDKGHFFISKLIIKMGATSTILDIEGKYGMNEFAGAIVDTPENLVKIQKVLDTNEFKILKRYFCGIGSDAKNSPFDGNGTMFKFFKEFRKDFWKDFYTDGIEQELIQEGKLNPDGSFNISYKGE